MVIRAVTVLLPIISTAALYLSSSSPIFSSISASPSSLPSFPPAISSAPKLPPPSLSPDINPELPTSVAGSGIAGSSSSNNLPTIPSTLSPPNPDDVASPELDLASSPTFSPAKMSFWFMFSWSEITLFCSPSALFFWGVFGQCLCNWFKSSNCDSGELNL